MRTRERGGLEHKLGFGNATNDAGTLPLLFPSGSVLNCRQAGNGYGDDQYHSCSSHGFSVHFVRATQIS